MKMLMNGYTKIYQWAIRSQSKRGFNFENIHSILPQHKVIKEAKKYLSVNPAAFKYKETAICWLPDNIAQPIFYRRFEDVLTTLLSKDDLMIQENISLPNCETPYSYINNPEVNQISELHHGTWWSTTWQQKCKANSMEILVPLIFYMDGISIDAHGNLTLIPMNMTLGIFNTETRTKSKAWETLYFHPDPNISATTHKKSCKPIDKIQNLHNGIRVALESLKEVMDKDEPFTYHNFPWNNKTWTVKMKFSIAFFIGDTELHDKLCCRYGSYGEKIKFICRHCNCPTEHLTDPKEWKKLEMKLWEPKDFKVKEVIDNERWKALSHHPVKNFFHKLCFGSNIHNIHLATPGECLHMHQLGVAKRSIKSFRNIVFQRGDPSRRANREDAFNDIATCAQNFGYFLSRQSDRNFPNRLTFRSNFLTPTKKSGQEYCGIILGLVLALNSTEGRRILTTKALLSEQTIDNQIEMFKLILFMGQFLKVGGLERKYLPNLPAVIDKFIILINKNCVCDGMGNCLIKNHLYHHVPIYIPLWGPTLGHDSEPSETHHKDDTKAHTGNTQKNALTLIKETATRKVESEIVNRVMSSKRDIITQKRSKNAVAGSRFKIKRDSNGKGLMTWKTGNQLDHDKRSHIPLVINFISQL